MNDIVLAANQPLNEAELNELYAAAWPNHTSAEFGYLAERGHTWVTAHRDGRLVGFGYVVWDGAAHAFLLEPTVHPDERHQGLGRRVVAALADEAKALGADWLHVDYEERLEPFYRSCGFRHTPAGLIRLRD